MAQPPDSSPGPLTGIRVLDFTTVIAGPFCTQGLGDLGADVLKVEPPSGDASRWSGAPFRGPGFSGFLAQFNRNKRSVVLDLGQPRAREVAQRLAQRVDVLVQNFRPGVEERLGLGYDALAARNPGLVYVAITGFGPDGPYAKLPAYDHVIQGLTGLMPTQGGDGPPRLVQGGVADKSSGLTALAGTLAALFARERGGGRGQRVDVPMLDSYAAFALPESMMARSFPPLEAHNPSINELFRTWETSDGYVVGLVLEDRQFHGLCRVLGRAELIEDERFAGIARRMANFQALAPILAEEIRKLATVQLVERAREAGVPFAPVYDVQDFLSDPQVVHNRAVVESEDPRFGTTRYLRPPVRFERTPASLRRHAPRLGEHTDEVLSEAGFSSAEIAALRESGALG